MIISDEEIPKKLLKFYGKVFLFKKLIYLNKEKKMKDKINHLFNRKIIFEKSLQTLLNNFM